MKTNVLTVLFLIIVFSLSLLNIGNAKESIQPLFDEYLLGNEVEEADSAKELITLVETNYNENFVSKMGFVELHGVTKKLTGSNYYNEVLRLKNHYMTYQYEKLDIKEYAGHISRLNESLQRQGKEFLYVAVPFKVNPYEDNRNVPTGTTEYSNFNQDKMLEKLAEKGVETVDLRPLLHKQNPDWYSAFFRTDQHWKPETAFWAYTEMAEGFHQKYGYELDRRSMDLQNYQIDHYKDWFLGSQGKKTGRFYSGVDDFSLIYPKFDTEMTVKVPKHSDTRKGSYYDVMIKKARLKKDYYNVNTYAAYIGGDYPLCIQHNDSARNDASILVLKDSFTIAFQPYLSFLFKDVYVVDLREFTGQKRTMKHYVNKYDPDMVMMFYTSSMFSYPEAFEVEIE